MTVWIPLPTAIEALRTTRDAIMALVRRGMLRARRRAILPASRLRYPRQPVRDCRRIEVRADDVARLQTKEERR